MDSISPHAHSASSHATAQMTLSVASTTRDFADVERIARTVYRDECGWFSTNDLRLRDAYSELSFCFLARLDEQAVGIMRIVKDSPLGLPVERFTQIRHLIRGNAIECQRLMVLDEVRHIHTADAPFGIFGALIKATLYYCLREGVQTVIADLFTDTATTPTKQLKRIGFRETGLLFRDTELTDESDSTVYALNLKDLVEKIYIERSPLNDYLISPDGERNQYRVDLISMENVYAS